MGGGLCWDCAGTKVPARTGGVAARTCGRSARTRAGRPDVRDGVGSVRDGEPVSGMGWGVSGTRIERPGRTGGVTGRAGNGIMAAGPRDGRAGVMGEHEERRARESLVHERDPSLRDELASVLARIVADPELAPTVAKQAGVPQQDVPAFKTAAVFWSAVVEHTANGMASMERLVAAALGHFPHAEDLLALESRVREPSASKRALPDKLTRNEFASLLDRGSPWGMLVTECKDPDGTSMVMWVEGGSDQKLDLFIQRIVGRLRDFVDIDVLPVGRALRHGPVAEDWASSMIAAVPRKLTCAAVGPVLRAW